MPQNGPGGREQHRLDRARENGYLDATCVEKQSLLKAYGLWCWRLKLPMVWIEPRSRWSRFGSLHLDLFTSGISLTESGMTELCTIVAKPPDRISPHDAMWDRIPRPALAKLAARVQRVVVRAGNWEPAQRVALREGWNSGRVISFPRGILPRKKTA